MKKTKIITLSSLDTSKYEKNAPFYKVYYNLTNFFGSVLSRKLLEFLFKIRPGCHVHFHTNIRQNTSFCHRYVRSSDCGRRSEVGNLSSFLCIYCKCSNKPPGLIKFFELLGWGALIIGEGLFEEGDYNFVWLDK